MGKLINRIPGSHLLIVSLPGSALRTHVESLNTKIKNYIIIASLKSVQLWVN